MEEYVEFSHQCFLWGNPEMFGEDDDLDDRRSEDKEDEEDNED